MTDETLKIPLSYLLTPQEHLLMGGSSPGGSADPYKPVGVKGIPWDPDSKFDLSEIVRERKLRVTFQSGSTARVLGFQNPAVISLPELDSEGDIIVNAEILGSWDPAKEQIVKYPGRDLTREYVEKSKASGIEIPMRETEPPRDVSRS